jgi:hypothetical protein
MVLTPAFSLYQIGDYFFNLHSAFVVKNITDLKMAQIMNFRIFSSKPNRPFPSIRFFCSLGFIKN